MIDHRKTILGVPVDAYQPEQFILKIEQGLQHPGVKTIFAVNAEKIMAARNDPELFAALNDSDFLIPDGFGPVVGLRLIYGIDVFRTTGVRLMEKLLAFSDEKNKKAFIFGAKPDVIQSASENIKIRYEKLDLVGTQHGYIPEEEYEDLVRKINFSGAEFLFVNLGSPKQEKWIHRYKKILNVKFCMGVGGSLDIIAGKSSLAPSWISNLYLEWIYRLIREPRRFGRQKVIPIFIMRMLIESLLSKLNSDK